EDESDVAHEMLIERAGIGDSRHGEVPALGRCQHEKAIRLRRRAERQRDANPKGPRHRLLLLSGGARPQFPKGIVSTVSFVSTTNTASSLAGSVSLALALTAWR